MINAKFESCISNNKDISKTTKKQANNKSENMCQPMVMPLTDDIIMLQEFALEDEYHAYILTDEEYAKIEAYDRIQEQIYRDNIQAVGFNLDCDYNCDVFDINGSGYCDF